MDTTNLLISSDIATGVFAAFMTKMGCKSERSYMLWKPFIEGIVLSITGRWGQSYLAGSWLSSKPTGGTAGDPYLRTETGRSSIIIAIASGIYAYVMKNKNDAPAHHIMLNVSADVLANEMVKTFMATDSVWLAGPRSS